MVGEGGGVLLGFGGLATPTAVYYVLITKTISKQQCQIILHLNAKCLITVTKVTAATTYGLFFGLQAVFVMKQKRLGQFTPLKVFSKIIIAHNSIYYLIQYLA